MYDHEISIEEAINLFFENRSVSNLFVEFYKTLDMKYKKLSSLEKSVLIEEIYLKIKTDTKNVDAPERTQVWFDGWKENLDMFRQNKNKEAITPKFLRPNNPVRFDGDYIIPSNDFFERDMSKLFQIFIYDNFLVEGGINNVYEFGCGSGFNLLFLGETYNSIIPDLSMVGLDYVQSSVDLINELGLHYDYKLTGKFFDMKKPDHSYVIKDNSCVFTACALEQLGTNFVEFIDYLVQQKPRLCFHLEPILENYDPTDDFDRVAIEFHRKRGYLEGLKFYLQDLHECGIINIEFDKRFRFGSLFHEGYHLIVWRINE